MKLSNEEWLSKSNLILKNTKKKYEKKKKGEKECVFPKAVLKLKLGLGQDLKNCEKKFGE